MLSGYYNCDSTSIRLRFDYDDSYRNYDSTRRSGHRDNMLMKAWIHTRRHFTSEAGKRAIPTSTIKGCYPMLVHQRKYHSNYRNVHLTVINVNYIIICPTTAFFIGYWLDEKMNMFIFVAVESKPNRSRIVILITMSQSNQSQIEVESQW